MFHSTWKSENKSISKFNNSIAKIYTKIYSHIHPNEKSALLYYFKAFNESFSFFLGEKDVRNLEGCIVVLVKIGNNMFLTKKIQRKSFVIFDPKGRTIQMSKKESESENDEMSTRFMGALSLWT